MKKYCFNLIMLVLLLWFFSACTFPYLQTPETVLPNQLAKTEVMAPSLNDPTVNVDLQASQPDNVMELLQPEDLTYLGAFRLPDDGDRPRTFEYSGNAMTYFPGGDAAEDHDDFPGSLFIMGHDRLPYGEMSDGNQVAEVSIPIPLTGRNINDLNSASFLQPFTNVLKGFFNGMDEIPRAAMTYLDSELTGPSIHLAWGTHLQEGNEESPSHGWFSLDLTSPDFQGEWHLANANPYSVNGYMLSIPKRWADQNTSGMQLASGRYRDGGWSGMGPSLYAYQPWLKDGSAAPDGSQLPAIALLQYDTSIAAEDFTHAMRSYSHADEWEGSAWLTEGNGRSAVIFVGTKSVGEKYWYGWQNPQGTSLPCIETEYRDQFTICRFKDGTPCPAEDLQGCTGHNDYRGWWSSEFRAQILFYNPTDLAQVADGSLQSWQPQPYAVLDIDDVLFHNPDNVETDMLGSGIQRRFRIGDAAFDADNGLLYILELFADGAKPIVHVWKINSAQE